MTSCCEYVCVGHLCNPLDIVWIRLNRRRLLTIRTLQTKKRRATRISRFPIGRVHARRILFHMYIYYCLLPSTPIKGGREARALILFPCCAPCSQDQQRHILGLAAAVLPSLERIDSFAEVIDPVGGTGKKCFDYPTMQTTAARQPA